MGNDDLVGVTVNEDVCIGAGQCEMLEDEIFYVNEDTAIAGVIGTGVLPRDRATRVAETCPSGAILIVEIAAGGGEEE